MKKNGVLYSLAFCLVLLILCLTGCASVSRPLLDYQNDLYRVGAEFETCGAKYKIEITYGENGAMLEIKEPENISGVKFIKEADAAFAEAKEVKIPLSPEMISKIQPIFDAFTLSPDNIANISKDERGNTLYSVSSESGAYTVTIGAEGLPISIVFEGERTFEISGIVLEKMT